MWNPPYAQEKVEAALSSPHYSGPDLLPANPPAGAQRLTVLDRDPRGYVLAAAFNSTYNANGFFDARAGLRTMT